MNQRGISVAPKSQKEFITREGLSRLSRVQTREREHNRDFIITLPEFQRGYEAGKQASIEHDEQPFLIDTELIEILKDFVAEGLFSDVDEVPLHWHIGNLFGLIERTALHSGKRAQRVIVQVRDNLALTVSLIPL